MKSVQDDTRTFWEAARDAGQKEWYDAGRDEGQEELLKTFMTAYNLDSIEQAYAILTGKQNFPDVKQTKSTSSIKKMELK